MADDEFTAFLRTDNATKGYIETAIIWPEPSKIPAIIRDLTRGMTNAPGAYWLTLPVWSAPEAGWLAVGIDPHQAMPPTWRIPGPRESREATAREGVAVITARLIAAVGERGSPADYVRAIRSLEIHPEWLGNRPAPVDEGAPQGLALEEREKALVDWLDSKGIPRAERHRLKTCHRLTLRGIYDALKDHPAFKSRHSPTEPITPGTFADVFWKAQDKARLD